MKGTFLYCSNLKSASNIPVKVADMSYTFADCKNLTGSFYIKSNNVSNCHQCLALFILKVITSQIVISVSIIIIILKC